MIFINFTLIATLVLSSNVLSATPRPAHTTIVSAADKAEMLRVLLVQQPWDKQRLQRMFALAIRHDSLAISKRRNSQQEMQDIEADPDYIPSFLKIANELVSTLPFEQQKIEKLLLWRMIDPQGKQHWLFGAMHNLTFANFAEEARLQLERIIDAAAIIMHEHLGEGLVQTLLDIEDYERAISVGKLDDQIVARGMHGGKKIAPLETVVDMIMIQAQLEQEKPSRTLSRFATVPAYILSLFHTVEREAAARVASLELGFAVIGAYVTADVSKMRVDAKRLELISNDIGSRNHLWLDRIVTQCEQNTTCLIVAGHGHMTHDSKKVKSIITLLRERGFTIELVE